MAILVAVIGLIVLADAVRVALTVRDLQHSVNRLLGAAQALGTQPSQWTRASLDEASRVDGEEDPRIRSDVATLHSDPLLKIARRLPWAGPNLQAVLDLGDASQAASAAYPDFIDIGRSYLETAAGSSSPGQRILKLLQDSTGPAGDAYDRLDPAVARLGGDRSLELAAPVRRELDRAYGQLAPLASSLGLYHQAAQLLPAALGAGAPQTYLVLLPNPTELRPAGGYMGAVGQLTFSGGNPSVRVVDQYSLNGHYRDVFAIPPTIGRYLHFDRNSFEIGDSGWDPDFPASAQLAQKMYASAKDTQTAGAVSIDPYAIQALLAVTGPVDVPVYGSFDSTNFLSKLNVIVNVDTSATGGKAALGPVSQAVFAELLTAPPAKWADLAKALQESARQRHIQVYADQPQLEDLARAAGVSGALPTPNDAVDFLMKVDANVGATKGDFFAQKSLKVRVERYPEGIVRHEVIATYAMPDPATATDKTLNPGEYRDYLRFYLPETATVHALNIYFDGKVTDLNYLDSLTLEGGHRVAAAALTLPRGHTAEVHLYYEVPMGEQRSYQLFIQKQGGIPQLPTQVEISYPGAVYKGGGDGRTDQSYEVSW